MKLLLTFIILSSFSMANCQREILLIDTLGVDSLKQVFHQNGELFYQIPYLNGEQNGWCEQYHDNGAVWTKDLRVNGKTVDGFNVAYHKNGKLYQKGYYKNGHQVGKWYSYSSDGLPSRIYIYNRKGSWIKLKIWNEKENRWEKSGLY